MQDAELDGLLQGSFDVVMNPEYKQSKKEVRSSLKSAHP